LQQSTFRRYAAIVLLPFFYFCCFRCVTVPLTGVINYVFFAFITFIDDAGAVQLTRAAVSALTCVHRPRHRVFCAVR